MKTSEMRDEFDVLNKLQDLCSSAIADEHVDAELSDTLSIANSEISGDEDFQVDAAEHAVANQERYRLLPQLALRGFFLTAIASVEDFFRFFAKLSGSHSKNGLRDLKNCRRSLLANWTDRSKSDQTKIENEEKDWCILKKYFEIRNLLMHVDEKTESDWNNMIEDAVRYFPSIERSERGIVLPADFSKKFICHASTYFQNHIGNLP